MTPKSIMWKRKAAELMTRASSRCAGEDLTWRVDHRGKLTEVIQDHLVEEDLIPVLHSSRSYEHFPASHAVGQRKKAGSMLAFLLRAAPNTDIPQE